MITINIKRAFWGGMACFLASGLVSCKDLEEKISSGAETVVPVAVEPNLTEATIGPNLNGSDWKGEFRTFSANQFVAITATVRHVGNEVIIVTSKQGLAHKFTGVVDAVGNIFMIDEFDGEDWTTLQGPVSVNSLTLSDFVFVNGSKVETNFMSLKR